MTLVIDNVVTQAIIGGRDNLLPFNLFQELDNYLKVKVQGAFYSKAYKRGWDGYRHFITKNGAFATGFLPFVLGLLKDLGVVPKIQDERGILPFLSKDIDRQVGSQTLRHDQVEQILKLNNFLKVGDSTLYFPRGIYDMATNYGKTTMIAGIQKNWMGGERTTGLFLTQNATVYDDAYPRLREALGDIGEIRADKFEPKWFTIAMAKTLSNRLEASLNVRKLLNGFKVLYVDETHTAGSASYSELLKQIGAGVRIFVSGTPLDNEDKIKNMVIVGLSGKTLAKVTNKELIDKGISQRPIIHFYLCDTSAKGYMDYDDEMEDLIFYSKERMELIKKLVMERKGTQVIISFNDIAHGEFMFDNLAGVCGDSLDMVHGKLSKIHRNKVYDRFKSGQINVLLTSMVLKEGANIPNIRTWIRTESGKSKITTKQIVGRTVRLDGVNDTVEIIDFFDVGKYVSKHSRIRMRWYRKEGFEIIKHYDQKEERKSIIAA